LPFIFYFKTQLPWVAGGIVEVVTTKFELGRGTVKLLVC